MTRGGARQGGRDAAWPGAVGPAPPLRLGASHWGIVFS